MLSLFLLGTTGIFHFTCLCIFHLVSWLFFSSYLCLPFSNSFPNATGPISPLECLLKGNRKYLISNSVFPSSPKQPQNKGRQCRQTSIHPLLLNRMESAWFSLVGIICFPNTRVILFFFATWNSMWRPCLFPVLRGTIVVLAPSHFYARMVRDLEMCVPSCHLCACLYEVNSLCLRRLGLQKR